MEKQRSGSKPLWFQFVPFQDERDEHDFERVWHLTQFFLTWAKVEIQGSGSKPLWDQFGPFQNERDQNNFKKVWNLTPLVPTWTKSHPKQTPNHTQNHSKLNQNVETVIFTLLTSRGLRPFITMAPPFRHAAISESQKYQNVISKRKHIFRTLLSTTNKCNNISKTIAKTTN